VFPTEKNPYLQLQKGEDVVRDDPF